LAAPGEIVSGLLHAGTKGVLASGSKAGKTWVLLDLAISVATGSQFLKWNTAAGKVLFINFEIHRTFIKGRLQIIKDRKQVANLDNLSVWTLRGQSADFDELLGDIIQRIQDEKYSLIVLDPIYKLMVGRSESTASGVGVLCHNIERLVEMTGAAVVYAHHFTKGLAGQKESYGSNEWQRGICQGRGHHHHFNRASRGRVLRSRDDVAQSSTSTSLCC
jgi:RecA-family ATPase